MRLAKKRATDERYMKLALREATQARRCADMPFGAVIVDETSNKVVARARSTEITDGDVTAHAELKAIREAAKALGRLELHGLTLFTSGEPCTMCAAAIFHAKISRVVIASLRDDLPFEFRPRKIGFSELVRDCGYQVDVVVGPLREQVASLFEGELPGKKAGGMRIDSF
jgi:tRNA(Arg) A34 adenosine deaminase TadA